MVMSTINSTVEDLLLDIDNDTTVCAVQLIGESLEGLSGRILWGIIQIILMVLGNIGNILTLIVLNRRLMRKGGVNNLLQGLAISDIIAPTIACIPHIIYYYGSGTNDNLINFINIYVMPIATAATFGSNWIVVTITAFRLIIVVKPLYSQVYCSSRNEKRALIVIFLCSILSITPYYYYHRPNTKAQNIIKLLSAMLSLFGPWFICVLLWILLIRIVNREIGLKKSEQFTLHSEIVAQRLKAKSKITKMVLIICFFTIICQLPVLILTIIGLIINGLPCGYLLSLCFVCLLFISNLLLIVNHSVNFIIYSLTNQKFRFTLKIMYHHCCFFYKRRLKKQRPTMLTTLHDEQRKIAYQYKYDYHSCLNSKNHDSPHLIITKQSRNLLQLNHQHNLRAVSL